MRVKLEEVKKSHISRKLEKLYGKIGKKVILENVKKSYIRRGKSHIRRGKKSHINRGWASRIVGKINK